MVHISLTMHGLAFDRSLVDNVPEGVHIDFLRAERSLHRWAHEDVQRIHMAEQIASTEGAGVQMHVLEDAGHWVCFLIVLVLFWFAYLFLKSTYV